MSHPFGDLLTQYLHRKHGLSQAKLAAGLLQAPSIISEMCHGKRLHGPQARERVTAIIAWLRQQGALTTLDEANALLDPLRSFVLPGGGRLNAELHLCRTICRRAERRTVTLALHEVTPPEAVQYLNRLSDALFVWSRLASKYMREPETLWQPNQP